MSQSEGVNLFDKLGIDPDKVEQEHAEQQAARQRAPSEGVNLFKTSEQSQTPTNNQGYQGYRVEDTIKDLLVGALQGMNKGGHALNQFGVGQLNKAFGTNLPSPEGANLYEATGTTPNWVSKGGEMIPAAVLSEATGGAFGAKELLPRALSYALSTAATTEGDSAEREKSGLMAALAPFIGKGVSKVAEEIPNIPAYLLNSSMGKRLQEAYPKAQEKAKKLYDTAFEGTEDIRPTVSPETIYRVHQLSELPKTESTIKEALLNLEHFKSGSPSSKGSFGNSIGYGMRSSSLLDLHNFKSDLNKYLRELVPGTNYDINVKNVVQKTVDTLKNDLNKSFSKLHPEKAKEYDKAQNYYRENIGPFHDIQQASKAVGKNKEIEPSLKSSVMKSAEDARMLRKHMGMSRGSGLAVDRLSKLLRYGVPTVAALGGAKKAYDTFSGS